MIFGIGTDIVSVARIEKMLEEHGIRTAEKLLAESELADYHATTQPAAFLAKRFAAKEALGKALGLGLRAPATLHNIAIAHGELGRPLFKFAQPLTQFFEQRGLQAHLSISDESGMATAFVVVEYSEKP